MVLLPWLRGRLCPCPLRVRCQRRRARLRERLRVLWLLGRRLRAAQRGRWRAQSRAQARQRAGRRSRGAARVSRGRTWRRQNTADRKVRHSLTQNTRRMRCLLKCVRKKEMKVEGKKLWEKELHKKITMTSSRFHHFFVSHAAKHRNKKKRKKRKKKKKEGMRGMHDKKAHTSKEKKTEKKAQKTSLLPARAVPVVYLPPAASLPTR